jgi:hypothetical protein
MPETLTPRLHQVCEASRTEQLPAHHFAQRATARRTSKERPVPARSNAVRSAVRTVVKYIPAGITTRTYYSVVSLSEVDSLAIQFAEVAPFEFSSSPLYRALGPIVAKQRPLLELIAFRRAGQQPTNLFFAAVHFLVLRDNDHPLRSYFPSVGGTTAADHGGLEEAFLDFCDRHRDDLGSFLKERLVQTNVVKRAAALRLALADIGSRVDVVHVVEVGASSGIHLLHDRYRYELGGVCFGALSSPVTVDVEWRGSASIPDLDRVPATSRRLGVDLQPVDPQSDEDRLWLRALVWPENQHEAASLESALAVVASDPPELLAGDIIDLVDYVDEKLPAGEPRVVFHAATRAHVPPDRRPLFDQALLSLSERAPLYTVSLEGPAPGDPRPSQFAPFHVLKLRAPEGDVRILALVEGHGDWIEPQLRVEQVAQRSKGACPTESGEAPGPW